MPDEEGNETPAEKKLRRALKRRAVGAKPKGTLADIKNKIKKKKKKEEGK